MLALDGSVFSQQPLFIFKGDDVADRLCKYFAEFWSSVSSSVLYNFFFNFVAKTSSIVGFPEWSRIPGCLLNSAVKIVNSIFNICRITQRTFQIQICTNRGFKMSLDQCFPTFLGHAPLKPLKIFYVPPLQNIQF